MDPQSGLATLDVPNNTGINLNTPLASSRADFAEALGRDSDPEQKKKYYYASVRTRYVVLLLMNGIVVDQAQGSINLDFEQWTIGYCNHVSALKIL